MAPREGIGLPLDGGNVGGGSTLTPDTLKAIEFPIGQVARKKVSRPPAFRRGRFVAVTDEDDYDVDILARPRVRQFLVLLREAELAGEPYITAGDVETRLPLSTRHAIKMRAYAEHWKLTTEETGLDGRRIWVHIHLTQKGREVADYLIRVRRLTHGDAKVRQPRKEGHY